jgi:hypothetical protein
MADTKFWSVRGGQMTLGADKDLRVGFVVFSECRVESVGLDFRFSSF